jgi:outer membrane protein assembly factor BamB
MAIAQAGETKSRKPLRLWPAVLFAVLYLLLRFVVPVFQPEAMWIGVMSGFVSAVAILVWWVFFSRAPWGERLGAVGLMIVAMLGTWRFLHESIATGAMGYLFPVLAIPLLCLAFAGWAVATHRLPDTARRVTMAATILLACGAWTLFKTGGFTGEFDNDLMWRWAETPEERLLAQAGDETAAVKTPDEQPPEAQAGGETAELPPVPAATEAPEEGPAAPVGKEPEEVPASAAAPARAETAAVWPGFRGPRRDGVVRGVQIATDWSASPPVELWRRPIGPGWSSFAVQGNLLYTQEQRGDEEVVSCYNLTTGELVWKHGDAARFYESNGGAGPRGTPTLSNGRVYSFGATGILNALDAGTGGVVWSRDAATDTRMTVPGWGFSSSPLVIDDLVIVAASGRLAGFDLATGEPRWFGPDGGTSYSSPHRLTIGGVTQVLLMSAAAATGVSPADGKVLWRHPLPPSGRIVQPALTREGDLLIGDGETLGMHRLAITQGPGGWTSDERWASIGLKPNFNDFVVHDGHAFGFDGNMLACIDLADGQRKWKGGRYGHGQLVLLADQDVLLVLSEKGELALVKATPDQFTELARLPAIEGKTWNHPVLAGDVLLVRNGEEMVAFRLALAAPPTRAAAKR